MGGDGEEDFAPAPLLVTTEVATADTGTASMDDVSMGTGPESAAVTTGATTVVDTADVGATPVADTTDVGATTAADVTGAEGAPAAEDAARR